MSAAVEIDAREVCEALGIRADDYRIHWARTITLPAGTVQIAVDLDLRKLTEEDRVMLAGLGETLRALSALEADRGDA